jgi:hypothetical protein
MMSRHIGMRHVPGTRRSIHAVASTTRLRWFGALKHVIEERIMSCWQQR